MSNRFALSAIFTGIDRMTATVKGMQASVSSFTKSASKGLGDLDGVNSRVTAGIKATAVAMAGVGVTAGALAHNVIGVGADFEQAITNVGAVSLMTRDQIADLEKEALRLGANTKFSAVEVANAMEMMGKAGFDNAQILQGVGGILAAAAAEGAGLEETASNVSNVLKGMGLATSESGRVADVLTLASARTNSSISSLGESMKNVSSTARTFGIKFEDTVAAVALLQDVGLDASEAGSSLNSMLTMMAAPSAAVSAQMKELGVSFSDAQGNMLPFTDVLGQLSNSAQKSGGNMKQVAFFADLLGMRGAKAAGNLKDLFNEGKVTKLKTELDGAAGSAEKMAGIRMDTLLGDWEQFDGAINSTKIAIFNLQNGPLRGVVQEMTKWVDVNRDVAASGVSDFIREATPLIKGFGEGLRFAFIDLGSEIKGVAKFFGVFTSSSMGAQSQAYFFAKDLVKWGKWFVIYSVGIKAASAATWAISNATKIARVSVIAYEATVRGVRGAIILYEIASKAGVASTVAMSVASKAAAVDMAVMKTQAFAAGGGFTEMAKTAGAAGLAIGAIYLAWSQLDQFQKQNGGWEGVSGFLGLDGGRGGFEGVDDVMNRQAREQDLRDNPLVPQRAPRAPTTPQEAKVFNALDKYGLPPPQKAPGPGGYAAAFGITPPATGGVGMPPPATAPSSTTPQPAGATVAEVRDAVKQSIEVTLKVPGGVSAEVTKKPAGAKVNLKPSGDL